MIFSTLIKSGSIVFRKSHAEVNLAMSAVQGWHHQMAVHFSSFFAEGWMIFDDFTS
jgi:hypothetical protein